MTLSESVLKRWGMLPSQRKPVKKSKRHCPVCMGPQVLRNFSFGKAYVCADEDCHYKRPYTVDHPFQVKFTKPKKGGKKHGRSRAA